MPQKRPLSPAERQRNYRKRLRREEKVEFKNGDAVIDLLESLPRVRPTFDGPYTFEDRARDFIAVFSGTDAGRRVLSQIHQICDPVPTRADADKPGTLAFNAGMRRTMLEIMLCFVVKEQASIEKMESM